MNMKLQANASVKRNLPYKVAVYHNETKVVPDSTNYFNYNSYYHRPIEVVTVI